MGIPIKALQEEADKRGITFEELQEEITFEELQEIAKRGSPIEKLQEDISSEELQDADKRAISIEELQAAKERSAERERADVVSQGQRLMWG